MHPFAQFADERKLVSIRRKKIDPNSIQGFVLGYSDDLVLIQYVYDFRLDGLTILRTTDITDIRCNETGEFQKQLLVDEQVLQEVPFGTAFDLSDWRSIITQLSRKYRLMILEDEKAKPQQFLIGTIEKITTRSVWLRYFSGAGNWDAKPTNLLFKDITACQVGTNYLNVYERYFDRHVP
jgi:hypothetical protein